MKSDDDDDLLRSLPDIQLPDLGVEEDVEEYWFAVQSQIDLINELSTELAYREIEGLALYEPTPYQQRYHQSRCGMVILQGGNRSGKSLCGFVEDSRALTGQDPFKKYPSRGGTGVIIGADLDHVGTVVYKYLFLPGAYHIIRDLHTEKWRPYKPWIPEDIERKKERRPAPPLIPSRWLASPLAWHIKAKRQFTLAQFTTGWELKAVSSMAEPPQGYQADFGHIDEDLKQESHFTEIQARLLDREGYLRVTAMPHAENEFITTMNDLAEDDEVKGIKEDSPERVCVRIQVSMLDNPHLDPDAKEKQAQVFLKQGMDVYNRRVRGLLGVESLLMYPMFDQRYHLVPMDNRAHLGPLGYDHPILRDISSPADIPLDWCLYTWTDPGHTVCATHFVFVPPPEYGDFWLFGDELYITSCTAKIWAAQMKAKLRNRDAYAFGIDDHGSRTTEIGSGITPYEQYKKALEQENLESISTKTDFLLGSDDVDGRVGLVRLGLSRREDAPPQILFLRDWTLNTQSEFKRYRKITKKVQGIKVVEDKPRTINNHLMNCMEYAIANGCPYKTPPRNRITQKSMAQRMIEQLHGIFNNHRAHDQAGYGSGSINLGPQGYERK